MSDCAPAGALMIPLLVAIMLAVMLILTIVMMVVLVDEGGRPPSGCCASFSAVPLGKELACRENHG